MDIEQEKANKDMVQNTRDIQGQSAEYKGLTRTGYRIQGMQKDKEYNTRDIQGPGTEYKGQTGT